MKKVFVFLAATMAVGLASFFAARSLRSATVPKTPFTATIQESTEIHAAGAVRQQHRDKIFFAARSDGSTVDGEIAHYEDGQDYVIRSVTLVPGKVFMLVSEAITSVATTPLSEGQIASLVGPIPVNCVSMPNQNVLGRENFMGYDVIKLEQRGKFDRTEVWAAPGLDCFPVRRISEWWNPDGSLNTRTIREVRTVALGIPAAELFSVPTGYVERTPSEIQMEESRRFIGYVPDCLYKTAEKMDRNYYRARSGVK